MNWSGSPALLLFGTCDFEPEGIAFDEDDAPVIIDLGSGKRFEALLMAREPPASMGGSLSRFLSRQLAKELS